MPVSLPLPARPTRRGFPLCARLSLGALALLACAAGRAADADSAAPPAGIENAVVKIFSTIRYPDPYRPWSKQSPSEATASGVVIPGKRILTNAHVVGYASQVQIQGNQAGDKLSASVVAVAPGIDLAVLKLDDESFFDTHPPIQRAAALPQIKDAVLAYGFPTGGNSLSITKGIVSRIEFVSYNYPVSGLRIQIDAAINPGNSGGPAMAGDRMIGLAFSHLNNAQNIGYIIPNEEIDLFLQDIADGHYDGKPAMHDELQSLENPALRAYLKLDKSVSGAVVSHPRLDTASYPLKEWDVITQIAGQPVDDQGMVRMGDNLRVGFQYLIQKVAVRGKVPLRIVRAGKTLDVEVPTTTDRPLLVPDLHGDYPPYFVYGPVVFSRATWQFAASIFAKPALVTGLSLLGSPLVTRRSEAPSPEREELVVVCSPFFPHSLTAGYSDHSGSVLRSVNGIQIRSLRHLVEVLRDMRSEFVTFEFDQVAGERLVFRHQDMLKATEEILTDNGVRAQGSPELLEVWKGHAAH